MRVAASRYPGESFAKMRKDLAGIVMKACYTDTPDRIITELDDPDAEPTPTQTTNV
jgi:hypothetical protein